MLFFFQGTYIKYMDAFCFFFWGYHFASVFQYTTLHGNSMQLLPLCDEDSNETVHKPAIYCVLEHV